ncbi:MAG: BRCT domain-containing protein [Clostridium sp.]
MIEPKREWRKFFSLDEKIEKLKHWKIISPKATDIKELYYKGAYTDSAVTCDVFGFVDDNEIILKIEDKLHTILPDYFVEMQKRDRFIIVDIETPKSFSPSSGIREVAAILVEDYRVVDSIHLCIVNDEELYKLGYGQGLDPIESNEDLKAKFKKFISKYKCPLIAHNASFDRNFLKHWGWVDETDEFCCSMYNIKSNVKLENYKMETILAYYNIKKEQSHTAMQDILDLLEILKIIKIERWSVLGKASENKEKDTEKEKSSDTPAFNFKKVVSKEQREENKKALELAKENIIENIFDGKKIVFTGDMTKDRNDMMILATSYGATTASSISKKTDLVVVGLDPGKSKLNKANELNIKIITESEFMKLIKL